MIILQNLILMHLIQCLLPLPGIYRLKPGIVFEFNYA